MNLHFMIDQRAQLQALLLEILIDNYILFSRQLI